MFQKLFVKKILINCLEILFGSCIKNSCSMSLMVEIILAHKKISTSRNQNILSAVLTYWNNKNCRFFLHFTYIHVSFFLKRNIALLNLICLFACLFGIFRPTREFFTHIWRSHHYRWKTENFDLCSALMVIEQWEFLSVPHLLWHGNPFIMVISEDPWHSHLYPSVWQWCCHYLFLRLRSVAAGIRTHNFPLAGRTL